MEKRTVNKVRVLDQPRKRALAYVLVAGAVLVASNESVAQETDAPDDVVRAFHEALAKGDSTTALSLLAEDVVIYEAGGVEASREGLGAQPIDDDGHVQGAGDSQHGDRDDVARAYVRWMADPAHPLVQSQSATVGGLKRLANPRGPQHGLVGTVSCAARCKLSVHRHGRHRANAVERRTLGHIRVLHVQDSNVTRGTGHPAHQLDHLFADRAAGAEDFHSTRVSHFRPPRVG